MIGLPLMMPISLPEAMSEPVKVTAADHDVEDDEDASSRPGPRLSPREPEEVLDRHEGRRAAADRVEERDELRHLGHLHGAGRVEAEAAADRRSRRR